MNRMASVFSHTGFHGKDDHVFCNLTRFAQWAQMFYRPSLTKLPDKTSVLPALICKKHSSIRPNLNRWQRYQTRSQVISQPVFNQPTRNSLGVLTTLPLTEWHHVSMETLAYRAACPPHGKNTIFPLLVKRHKRQLNGSGFWNLFELLSHPSHFYAFILLFSVFLSQH